MNRYEELKIIKLKNGIELHLMPNNEPYSTTYCEVMVSFGAFVLDYKINGKKKTTLPGSAHFFEHKIFASPNGDHFEKLTKLGASANAYTTDLRTCYTFSTTDNSVEILKEVITMLQTPYFTKENVAKERDIIIEELNMYHNDVNYRISQRYLSNMFFQHPIKNEVLGSIEEISTITKDDLLTIFQDFYSLSQFKVIIAGKIEEALIIEMLEKTFNEQVIPQKIEVIKVKEPMLPVASTDILFEEVLSNKMILGIKLPFNYDNIIDFRDKLVYSLLFQLLLNHSSVNYEELMAKKLINNTFNFEVGFADGANFITISSDTFDPQQLFQELEKIIFNPNLSFTNSDFQRTKKVYSGNIVFALNDLEQKVYLYGEYLNNQMDLFESFKIINSITFEELINKYRNIKKEQFSLLIVKPK